MNTVTVRAGREKRRWLPVLVGLLLLSGFAGAEESFVRGDADGNGVIELIDPLFVLSYLLGEVVPACPDASDANDSGTINVVDVVYLLHFLFEPSFPALPPPYPECGLDGTDDELACELFPSCL